MYPGKTLAVAFALITAATVAGCGSAATPSGAPTGASPAASAAPAASTEHNDADVTFTQQMIPHHAQAVRMAELAPQRAGSTQVKQLAAAIQAAQQPEIDQMTAMLKAWGAPVPAVPADKSSDSSGAGDMPGMDHGSGAPAQAGMDHAGMAGMMSGSQMDQLSKASGAAFDRQFLALMIAHHEGAVQMSSIELRDGSNPEAKALAQKITDAQNAEIAQMRQMSAG
ncbi:MAG TPA: DUF305 domain-containing protein [Pseudonocardia sp.]|jgi:uncharacterized protein (DUF305 family)|nr:DUF305 domain-containing protein [Pseudonocardia sp.]